jgi:hypothetical protein
MATHVRTTQTGFGKNAGNIKRSLVDIDFRKGVDMGVAFDLVQTGYASAIGNFMPEHRGMTPRSGLTGFAENTKSLVTLSSIRAGWSAKDQTGTSYAYFMQKSSTAVAPRGLWFISGDAPQWKNISGGLQSDWPMDSTNSYALYDFTYMYDPNRAENIGVVTNNEDSPFYFSIGAAGDTAISAFTDGVLVNRAATVCAADDRLVFANVSGSDGRKANRVVWTVRGNPRNFTLASGAGYQDINEARGPFTKVISEGEGFLLFTETEIWRATQRRDTFAFDFNLVAPSLGLLNPRTVVSTPYGTVFVGSDYEVYAFSGNQLKPISWLEDHSRTARELRNTVEQRRMHATYDAVKRQYLLFYVSSTLLPVGEDYPMRVFVYDFATNSWWWWLMSDEIQAATTLEQRQKIVEGSSQWDEQSGTWNSQTRPWDKLGLASNIEQKIVAMVGGQTMAFSDDALADSRTSTTDTPAEIYAEWFSHGHTVPGLLHYYSRLEQAWIEYVYFPGPLGALPAHSRLSVGAPNAEIGIDLINTERSGLAYAYAPINDVDRAPIFDFYYSMDSNTSRPVFVRAQTIVSNDGEFQAST